MGYVVLAVGAELALFAVAAVLCVRSRTARKRELARFEQAAANAKRLAHHALIIDASIAELSELVIEESLREMGLEWVDDWSIGDWTAEPI